MDITDILAGIDRFVHNCFDQYSKGDTDFLSYAGKDYRASCEDSGDYLGFCITINGNTNVEAFTTTSAVYKSEDILLMKNSIIDTIGENLINDYILFLRGEIDGGDLDSEE